MRRNRYEDEYVPSQEDLEMVNYVTKLFGAQGVQSLPWFFHDTTNEIIKLGNIYDKTVWTIAPDCKVEKVGIEHFQQVSGLESRQKLDFIKNHELVEMDKQRYCEEYLYVYKEEFNGVEFHLQDFNKSFFRIVSEFRTIPQIRVYTDMEEVFFIIKKMVGQS